MTKKTKEFWVLICITMILPIIGGCILYGSVIYLPRNIDPIDEETVMNNTHITFIVANKYMYDDRVGIGINVFDYNFSNISESDNIEFKKQYTCNLTKTGWLINVTHSISDCKENKDFNYTKVFNHGV